MRNGQLPGQSKKQIHYHKSPLLGKLAEIIIYAKTIVVSVVFFSLSLDRMSTYMHDSMLKINI